MAKSSTSSSANSNLPGVWARWLVPSAADLLFVAFLSVLAFTNLSVRLLGDAGIGWHIRTGQLILASHAIPRVDPFSSSMAGLPWFAWEWLYDVLVGWIESAAGLNGVVLFTALTIATVFSWSLRLLLKRGTNLPVAVILVLLAASASMIHFLARPHVVSWLLTVTFFWMLESSENQSDGTAVVLSTRASTAYTRRRLIVLLPMLMLVWVNVHGGFLMGLALLGIYWVSAAWRWLRLTIWPAEELYVVVEEIRVRRRFWDLTVAGTLTALATLVNPYGWRLHIHIYRYLSNRFLMDRIDEFQSPNFHYVAQKCFAVLLLLTLLALAVRTREDVVEHRIIVLFAIFAGLYSSRNIPTSSLLLMLVTGPWLSEAMLRLPWFNKGSNKGFGAPRFAFADFLQRMKAIELDLIGHLWPAAAVAVTIWIATNGGRVGATQWMNAHFSPERFPARAVDYIEKRNAQGAICGPDFWGGYLIYRLYPRMKVVVDDRHDFYGEQFLESYLRMMHVELGWEDFLEQHPSSYVVLPKAGAAANIFSETARWQPVYKDDVAVVFVRPEGN